MTSSAHHKPARHFGRYPEPVVDPSVSWRSHQNLARRGLLSKPRNPIARLLFVNEPGVLDRDDRLIGEGLE